MGNMLISYGNSSLMQYKMNGERIPVSFFGRVRKSQPKEEEEEE
jgi:hypothetical protein